ISETRLVENYSRDKQEKQLQSAYNESVRQWLQELRANVESECLSALQAKSVALDSDAFEALSIRNAQISIYKIRCLSVDVIDGLDFLIDTLPITIDAIPSFKHGFGSVCQKLCEVIELCRRRGCDYSPYKGSKVSTAVSTICQQMIKFINDFGLKGVVNNAQLEATLRKLKERLGELVNLTIRRDCQVICDSLLHTGSNLCLKWSLLALWQLTQNDAYICRIFVEMRKVIKRLIEIFAYNYSYSLKINCHLKSAALRVLSYLCINPDAVVQIYENLHFEKDLIANLMNERNETVLREASALIVQLTTPFIDYTRNAKKDQMLAKLLHQVPISSLVLILTNISSYTTSAEVFLLVCAALANISFFEVEPFIKNETLWLLILKIKQKLNFNEISIKDQMVTIVANISSKFPLEIVNCGNLIFLINTLQLKPLLGMQSENDLNAIERIQQKIAVALARLGAHKNVAVLIYRLNGVRRLYELCKDAKERNFSDTVLLASLAALRRISNVIGVFPLQELDALDVINLNFRDSFLSYSCKNESYV
ncbi:inscuteable-like protein, partial [Dinothrombium tinctorium]